MRNSITQLFYDMVLTRNDITASREWSCIFPWKFGEAVEYILKENKGKIIRQHLMGKSFSMKQYEITLNQPLNILYQISHKNIHISYNLEKKSKDTAEHIGQDIEHRSENGKLIKKIKKNSFYPSCNTPEVAQVRLETGTTILLVISFRSSWSNTFKSFPVIIPLLENLNNEEATSFSLTEVDITEIVFDELKALFKCQPEPEGTLLAMVKLITTGTLGAYQSAMDTPFYKVIADMDRHYADEKVTLTSLLSLHNIAKSTFNRLFLKKFNMTPTEYVLQKRNRDLL